jgi:hypothetical protein
MGQAVPRVRNHVPAGLITAPITTLRPADQPRVIVHVEWEDGRVGDLPGVALGWCSAAVMVRFVGPDGLTRLSWFPSEAVQHGRAAVQQDPMPRSSTEGDGTDDGRGTAVTADDVVVGARIRAARQAAGVALTDLAAILGVKLPYLSKVETGRCHCPDLLAARIGRTLQVDAEAFTRPESGDEHY